MTVAYSIVVFTLLDSLGRYLIPAPPVSSEDPEFPAALEEFQKKHDIFSQVFHSIQREFLQQLLPILNRKEAEEVLRMTTRIANLTIYNLGNLQVSEKTKGDVTEIIKRKDFQRDTKEEEESTLKLAIVTLTSLIHSELVDLEEDQAKYITFCLRRTLQKALDLAKVDIIVNL